MKIISKGNKWQCPYCGTTVELESCDLHHWNSIEYYRCPTCHKTVHTTGSRFDEWLCPYNITGKRAKQVGG